jgi:hypothetical protein
MIKIFGHSDDCVEIEGDFTGENEFYVNSCDKVWLNVYDPLTKVSVNVTVSYACEYKTGVWSIAVEPTDEDKAMPKMSIEMAKNGYSSMLVIECSDKVIVTELQLDKQQ